jgi:hypothetical protein
VRWGLIKAMAGIAVAVVLVAGCSDKRNGTATPATTTGGRSETTSSPSRTSTSTSNGNGAPKVESPLDASKYLSQPCAILSAAVLQSYKITKPGKPDVDSEVAKTAGPACIWSSDDQPIPKGYNVGLLTGNKKGLSDTYRGGAEAFPGYFEPTDVSGYPAVFNGLTDTRKNGSCNITVGISDTLAFRAAVTFPSSAGATSCDSAKQLAGAVIQTLKGA